MLALLLDGPYGGGKIEIGPVKSALLSFGPVAGKYEGSVLGLGIGCFGELSAGFNDVCTQGGPGHVPLKDLPRVQSCGHFRLERPHLGSQPQAR